MFIPNDNTACVMGECLLTVPSVMCRCDRLKKVGEEKKEEKADPMLEMMQRIRSGNVNLKKVASTPPPPKKGGGVMAEMAQLLVGDADISFVA